MKPVENPNRKRAILTIAKKNNISVQEAQYRQAYKIAQKQARQK